MKEKVVNTVTDFIIKNKKCDEKKIKIIRYGLNGLYSLITKLLVVTILSLTLNTFKEFIAFFIAYTLLRTFSFGLHASNSLWCWIITIPIYVGTSLLIKFWDLPLFVALVIWFLAFISFILWAPADTPKRPIIREKTRMTLKIKTCVISLIYFLLIIISKNEVIINAVAYALMVQTIMINPLVYKLSNTSFNNYKYYSK